MSPALSGPASAASSMPRPSRLCSWTTRVTATPAAQLPGQGDGPVELGAARVEIFSGEDPGEARGRKRVCLSVQRLAHGGGAG
jgi:hypothetical protein